MTNNELQLIFGPKLPTEFQYVGLSFIAAPVLTSDTSIASLSSERYAPENFPHIDEELSIFSTGFRDGSLQVNINYDEVSFGGRFTTPSRLTGLSGTTILTGQDWFIKPLNTPIAVVGVEITKAGAWYPQIKPGVVSRLLTVSSTEPSSSWLKTSGLAVGDTVIAIYSVPEIAYTTTKTDVGLAFPYSTSKFKSVTELAAPNGPNSFSYLGEIYRITEIKINGVVRFSGSWKIGDVASYILSIDKKMRIVYITGAVQPDDYIEIKYDTYLQTYTYSGFRDVNNNWYPFDANPEYGHYIGDDRDGTIKNSADCLLDQVTIYAIPTAYIKYTFTASTTSNDNTIGSLDLQVVRGVEYNETHFVRHIVAGERSETIRARRNSTSVSTWGEAVFGRNYYDENGIYLSDSYSDIIPSMIPLGRYVLAAPASLSSIGLADIRQRGGGIPEDFPMVAVETQEDGLDTLRGFYDLGIWEGKAVKEGGVVEVRINSSLLKSDPDDTDPSTFLASEIYDIVKSQMPPGIGFEIVYAEDV